MIPRYQRILYWCLVSGILLMSLVILRGCIRDHQRTVDQRDLSPIPAPAETPEENATIANANDAEDTVNLDQASISLPQEPSTRATVLLNHVLTTAALPTSQHPVPPGPAVTDTFFLALPLQTPTPGSSFGTSSDLPQTERNAQVGGAPSPYGSYHAPGAILAVVNLSKSFVDRHPSGIETEDLTLRSILATLHANFPQIETVRFLVDGQTRETLAGHAILNRAYPIGNPAQSIHPLAADGTRE